MTVIQYNGGQRQTAPSTSRSPAAEVATQELSVTFPASCVDRGLLAFDGFGLFLDFDEIYASYTRTHLLRENGGEIGETGLSGPLKSQSLAALSTTYFGIHHMNQPIMQRGFHKYAQALSQLNHALGDLDAPQSSDAVEAIGVMTLFEVRNLACSRNLFSSMLTILGGKFLTSTRKDGWIAHARGAEQLFEIRGAESMMAEPWLGLLEKYRPTIILAAIISRRSTILSSSKWKEVPWLAHPEQKSSMKCLVDIMADCAELSRLQETLCETMSGSGVNESRRALLSKAYESLYALEAWDGTYAPMSPAHCTELDSPATTPSVVDSSGQPQPLWPTVLHFHSLYDANVMALYYSTLVLVLKVILSPELSIKDPVDHAVLQSRLRNAGIAICRSVDYHMEGPFGGTGTLFLLFPLRMAFDAVGKSDATIGGWLKGILERISAVSSGRWATSQYLLNINVPAAKAKNTIEN